jgi:hypothetical protein
MALARHEQDEIARRNEESERESRRVMHRDLLLTLVKLIACTAIGLFLIGMAFHVKDPDIRTSAVSTGGMYFLAGHIFWIMSVAILALNAYKRGVDRGDWY